MDAIRYFEIKKRMIKRCSNISCNDCPFAQQNNDMGEDCGDFEMNYPEKAIAIVEKWAEEHPVKTRQSEFLKLFPNAPTGEDGLLLVNPCFVDSSIKCLKLRSDGTYEYSPSICEECSKKYWFTKVEGEI